MAENFRCGALMQPSAIQNLLQSLKYRFVLPRVRDADANCHWISNPGATAFLGYLAARVKNSVQTDFAWREALEITVADVPDDQCTPADDAKLLLIGAWEAVRRCLPSHGREIIAGYAENGVAPAWGPDSAEYQAPSWEELVRFAQDIGNQNEMKHLYTSALCTALVAYCKAGSVNMTFLNKITRVISDEMKGAVVTLNTETIRWYWNVVSLFVDDAKIGMLFGKCRAYFGNGSPFLQAVNEIRWTNLTNFKNIEKALRQHSGFDWGKLHRLYPKDFENYERARQVVGNNPYYGLRRDLGDAKSTLYPNLCYASYVLQSQISGDRSLRSFQMNRSVARSPIIDMMVQQYKNRRMQCVGQDATEISYFDRSPFLVVPRGEIDPPHLLQSSQTKWEHGD